MFPNVKLENSSPQWIGEPLDTGFAETPTRRPDNHGDRKASTLALNLVSVKSRCTSVIAYFTPLFTPCLLQYRFTRHAKNVELSPPHRVSRMHNHQTSSNHSGSRPIRSIFAIEPDSLGEFWQNGIC